MMSLSMSLAVGLLVAAAPSGNASPPDAKAPAAASAPKSAGSAPVRHTVERPVIAPPTTTAAPAAPAESAPAAEKSAPADAGKADAAKATAGKKDAARQECDLWPVEAGILAQTNAHRARFGLRPLILDFGLLRTARRQAHWMSRANVMQHGNYPVAENIAMGQNSPQEALNSWMNSSGHRANILNTGYTRIGVAAYRNSNGTTFWCQQFSR